MSPEDGDSTNPPADLSAYAGRWIVRAGQRIAGQGGTPEQAWRAANQSRFKEKLQVSYVPTRQPLEWPALLQQVRQALPAGLPAFLVGGAVRDRLLGRAVHDMDFAIDGEARQAARRVADHLGAAYHPLHEGIDAGRVVLLNPDGPRRVLDFTHLAGGSLEADLRLRDFTINAMALSLDDPQALLDPLGGAADLLARRLRTCSPDSLTADPVRILRGVRLAAGLKLRILPETRSAMRQATAGLAQVSVERLRDELFRILDGPQPAAAIQALEMLGALPALLPDLPALKGMQQPTPHTQDGWGHTLEVVRRLESLLAALGPDYDPEKSANSLILGLAVLRLGRYREPLQSHLAQRLTPERSLRPLLFLAALYHDAGKPGTSQVDETGRLRFLGHEEVGARLASRLAKRLHLSSAEAQRLATIVRHHMRPLLLNNAQERLTRRAIYRFFRDTGPAGVDICLLSMADYQGIYGATIRQEAWAQYLEIIRGLLEAWWEKPAEQVSPPPLLDGRVLIDELGAPPGPQVGKILAALREAQATGEVASREDALALARSLLLEAKTPRSAPEEGAADGL
jgi:tRNA nucleotidyltransferase/poly(A) polymerase